MMTINYMGVLAAAVASWMFGALFYGVLGKQWMIALGRSEADIRARAEKRVAPIVPMIVSLIAELLMALMLAGLIGHMTGGHIALKPALLTAGSVWLGFVVTVLATNYAYQNARPLLTAMDSAHWLGALLVQATALALIGQG
jgi:hypothetical protein